MDTLLALGLANAACAAVLAVPAYLVSRYGKRPALAHALWLLVLLKLVTPPVLRPGFQTGRAPKETRRFRPPAIPETAAPTPPPPQT